MRVYCPYCREEKEYVIETREVKEFRGKEIDTYENVAMCKTCNNDLYVKELENENSKRIYEAYRQTENIIKPQDIIDLRNKYDISQRELTAILGFGKMTINRYERGGVPTKSQSDYIRLLIDNESKFIEKVKEAYDKNNITEKTYEKVISKENCKECNNDNLQNLIRKCIKLSRIFVALTVFIILNAWFLLENDPQWIFSIIISAIVFFLSLPSSTVCKFLINKGDKINNKLIKRKRKCQNI